MPPRPADTQTRSQSKSPAQQQPSPSPNAQTRTSPVVPTPTTTAPSPSDHYYTNSPEEYENPDARDLSLSPDIQDHEEHTITPEPDPATRWAAGSPTSTEGYPSWLPRRPLHPAPASTLQSSILGWAGGADTGTASRPGTGMGTVSGYTYGGSPIDPDSPGFRGYEEAGDEVYDVEYLEGELEGDLEGTHPDPRIHDPLQLVPTSDSPSPPPFVGGRKPSSRAVRIVTLQDPHALLVGPGVAPAALGTARVSSGGSGSAVAGPSKLRRESIDQTRVGVRRESTDQTRVPSSAVLPGERAPPGGLGLPPRVWTRPTAPQLPSHEEQQPRHVAVRFPLAAAPASYPYPYPVPLQYPDAPPMLQHPLLAPPRPEPRFNAKNLYLPMLHHPSRWMKAFFYAWPALVYYHVVVQSFLDFNAVFILIQLAKFPSAPPSTSRHDWTLAATVYVFCWIAWLIIVCVLYEVVYLFARRWRMQRPLIFPIYLSAPAFNLAAMSSYGAFCFLMHLRMGAFVTEEVKRADGSLESVQGKEREEKREEGDTEKVEEEEEEEEGEGEGDIITTTRRRPKRHKRDTSEVSVPHTIAYENGQDGDKDVDKEGQLEQKAGLRSHTPPLSRLFDNPLSSWLTRSGQNHTHKRKTSSISDISPSPSLNNENENENPTASSSPKPKSTLQLQHTRTWKQGLAETSNIYAQNLPTVALLLPRAGICLGVLFAYASSSSGLGSDIVSLNTIPVVGSRDATFFRADGTLTSYARGVMIANVAWTCWRAFVLLGAWLTLLLVSNHRLGGLAGPRHALQESRRSRSRSRDPDVEKSKRHSLGAPAYGVDEPYIPTGYGRAGMHPGQGEVEKQGGDLFSEGHHRHPIYDEKEAEEEEEALPWEWRDRTRERVREVFELCVVREPVRLAGRPVRSFGRTGTGTGFESAFGDSLRWRTGSAMGDEGHRMSWTWARRHPAQQQQQVKRESKTSSQPQPTPRSREKARAMDATTTNNNDNNNRHTLDLSLDEAGIQRVLAAVGFNVAGSPTSSPRRGVLRGDLFEGPSPSSTLPQPPPTASAPKEQLQIQTRRNTEEDVFAGLSAVQAQGQAQGGQAPLMALPYPFSKPGAGHVSSKDSVPLPDSGAGSKKSGSKKSTKSGSGEEEPQAEEEDGEEGEGEGDEEEEEEEEPEIEGPSDEDDEDPLELDDSEDLEDDFPESEEPDPSSGRASGSLSSLGHPISPSGGAGTSRYPFGMRRPPHSQSHSSSSPSQGRGAGVGGSRGGGHARNASGVSSGFSGVSGGTGTGTGQSYSMGSGPAAISVLSRSTGNVESESGAELGDDSASARERSSLSSRSNLSTGIPMPPRHPNPQGQARARSRSTAASAAASTSALSLGDSGGGGGGSAGYLGSGSAGSSTTAMAAFNNPRLSLLSAPAPVAFPTRSTVRRHRASVHGEVFGAGVDDMPGVVNLNVSAGSLVEFGGGDVEGRHMHHDDEHNPEIDSPNEDDLDDEEERGENEDRLGLLGMGPSSPRSSLLGSRVSLVHSLSSGQLRLPRSRTHSIHSRSSGSRSRTHSSNSNSNSNGSGDSRSRTHSSHSGSASAGSESSVRERSQSLGTSLVHGAAAVSLSARASLSNLVASNITTYTSGLAPPRSASRSVSGSRSRTRSRVNSSSAMERVEEDEDHRHEEGEGEGEEGVFRHTPNREVEERVLRRIESSRGRSLAAGGGLASAALLPGSALPSAAVNAAGNGANVSASASALPRSFQPRHHHHPSVAGTGYHSSGGETHSRSGSESIGTGSASASASGGENYTFGRPVLFMRPVAAGGSGVLPSQEERPQEQEGVVEERERREEREEDAGEYGHLVERSTGLGLGLDSTFGFPAPPAHPVSVFSPPTPLTPSAPSQGELSSHPGAVTPVPLLPLPSEMDIPVVIHSSASVEPPGATRQISWPTSPATTRTISRDEAHALGLGTRAASGEAAETQSVSNAEMISTAHQSFVTAPPSVEPETSSSGGGSGGGGGGLVVRLATAEDALG